MPEHQTDEWWKDFVGELPTFDDLDVTLPAGERFKARWSEQHGK